MSDASTRANRASEKSTIHVFVVLMLAACLLLPEAVMAVCPSTAGRDFATWVERFGREARGQGIGRETISRAFAEVGLNRRVLELADHQPEFVQPVGQYLERRVSSLRTDRGRELYREHRELLWRVEDRYGVPGHYLVALWGLESNYSRHLGDFSVIEALATLGFAGGRRRAFGCRQLLAALQILERAPSAPRPLIGSWAGASGPGQFIPTSALEYGVDFDGDGQVNLWTSMPDVFASMANLLVRSSSRRTWTDDLPWGLEVSVLDGFDYGQTGLSRRRNRNQWHELGVRQLDGRPLEDYDSPHLALWMPEGHQGPIIMIFPKFRAIMGYNASSSYALSVSLLADRIVHARSGSLRTPWPAQRQPLNRQERIELQRLLTRQGYDTGGVDGVIGSTTSRAVQRYQRSVGRPADGLVDRGLLDSLRRSAESLSRDERIELQRLLTRQGYDTGGIDGIIGARTRRAIREYQESVGRPADGLASRELLVSLRRSEEL